MNPHGTAQQLLVALEAAMTERQFASALADYRAPRDERRGRRVQRDGMPSLRTLERCHNLPGKTNICIWESGDESKFVSFTEQQLRAYLKLCKITGKLFEVCIRHYRRIMQQGTIDQDKKASFTQQGTSDIGGINLDSANFRCRADLVYCLQQLHIKIGHPSYRELQKAGKNRGIKLPISTIGDLIGNHSRTSTSKLPWQTVKLFVLACGLPEAHLKNWRKAWEASCGWPRK